MTERFFGISAFGDRSYSRGRQLIIVSNRGPVEHYFDEEGRIQKRPAGGGVSSALGSTADLMPFTWIAAAFSDAERSMAERDIAARFGRKTKVRLVAPPPQQFDLFYNTFSNPLLWFIQHSMSEQLEGSRALSEVESAWEDGYVPVNQAMAEAVAREVQTGPPCRGVMLHDYHFYLTPLFIRNLVADVPLQYFVHIPWPGIDEWQALPHRIVASIHEGLLSNDSVVFQTERDVQAFLLTCWAFIQTARVDFGGCTVTHAGRRVRVWANPISVNPVAMQLRLLSAEAGKYVRRLSRETCGRTIVRVDRMDPSKNILDGFRAFDLLLKNHPEWAGRVRFLAFLVPSRTSIPEYRFYAQRVMKLVEAINLRHGTPDWTPIKVFYEQNRTQALAGLSLYDVLLVNSLADGMNLVAKEGPAVNRVDGVLVLSTGAGAHEELCDGALSIRPDDVEGTARALQTALLMSPNERCERAFKLRRALLRHDLNRWLYLLLDDLEGTKVVDMPSRQSERYVPAALRRASVL